MRLFAVLLLIVLGGCDFQGLVSPAARAKAELDCRRRPPTPVCIPGGEVYAVRIQGFPEYRDVTFYSTPLPANDTSAESGGSISHPLVSWPKAFVGGGASRDTCGFLAVANQVELTNGPLIIFPAGTKYSRLQLTASAAEADLSRGTYLCDWLSVFNVNDLHWGGQSLGALFERNTVFQRGGWRLVVNEEDLKSEWPVVNALHLYGPGRREVIISHLRAVPICP